LFLEKKVKDPLEYGGSMFVGQTNFSAGHEAASPVVSMKLNVLLLDKRPVMPHMVGKSRI